MIETLAEQPPEINEQQLDREQRIRTDTETWLAETLNGSMHTRFEFSFDGQELRGEDGGALRKIFQDSIEVAQIMASRNPGLLFELRRRLIESEELDDMESMAKGNLLTDEGKAANTIVVVSDFPPELKNEDDDVGGYNVNRQQTMLRLITLEKSGKISITTQSLDQSDRQGLEAIYKVLGRQPQPGELLGQRVKLTLNGQKPSKLVDQLTDTYDQALSRRYSGEWHAGIRQAPGQRAIDTYKFARSQTDLIDWFTEVKLADPAGAEKYRYKLAATISARYEGRADQSAKKFRITQGEFIPEAFISVASIARNQNLMMEMEREGMKAAQKGKVFSGCGSSASAEGESSSSTEGQFNELGYGNGTKFDANGKCEFTSKKCPKCHKKNVKTTIIKVGNKKHISGACGCNEISG